MKSIIGACILLTAALAPTFASNITIPGTYDSTVGNSGTSVPFAWSQQLRLQTVYNSSLFSSLSGPIAITGARYRMHPNWDPNYNFTTTNFQVTLSTSANSAGGLSTTFANNTGADATVVRSGSLTLTHTAGSGSGVRPFDVVLSFQTPFTYNPASGNLLFDYLVSGRTFWPTGAFWDSLQNTSGGSSINGVSSILTDNINQSNAYPLSCCPASDGTNAGGLIVQIEYEGSASAVPEPASFELIAGGSLLVLFARRRQASTLLLHSRLAERALDRVIGIC